MKWERDRIVHTSPGCAVWPMNRGGKTLWRVWIDGMDDLPIYYTSETEAKAYAEAMVPFAQLAALK